MHNHHGDNLTGFLCNLFGGLLVWLSTNGSTVAGVAFGVVGVWLQWQQLRLRRREVELKEAEAKARRERELA